MHVGIEILARQGKHAPDIAAALGVSLSKVYTVLRCARRGNRLKWHRKPRTRTSELRPQVIDLNRRGWSASCIAKELGISRAYVYRIIAEEKQRSLDASEKQMRRR